MDDVRTLEALKDLGAGRPAPDPIAALYREAFEAFGTRALWSRRPSAKPTIAQALVVAEGLRRRETWQPAPLRHGSWTPAVPLSSIQSAVLRLLASHRNPESLPLKIGSPMLQ